MQNLVYLIIMALAGGAGWYAGSWSGKDAKQALEAAQKAGEEIKVSRDKIQGELDSKILALTTSHDTQVQQIRSKFDSESVEWKTLLASRDTRIVALNSSAKTFRQQADDLTRQLGSAKSLEESNALKARIAALEGQAKRAEVEIKGVECSAQAVPNDMLAKLRGESP